MLTREYESKVNNNGLVLEKEKSGRVSKKKPIFLA